MTVASAEYRAAKDLVAFQIDLRRLLRRAQTLGYETVADAIGLQITATASAYRHAQIVTQDFERMVTDPETDRLLSGARQLILTPRKAA